MKYLQSFVKRFCSKAALSAAPDDAAAAAAVAASRGARNSSFEWANWQVFVAAYGQCPAMKYLQSLVLKRLADKRRSGEAAAKLGGPWRNSSSECANWHRPAAAKGHSARE